MSGDEFHPGLEGITVAETRLSHIDGEAGELLIAGFPVEELAVNATCSRQPLPSRGSADGWPTASTLEHVAVLGQSSANSVVCRMRAGTASRLIASYPRSRKNDDTVVVSR
ncbi:MAG: hypothetical protein V5A55_08185 [Halovenus sp.]